VGGIAVEVNALERLSGRDRQITTAPREEHMVTIKDLLLNHLVLHWKRGTLEAWDGVKPVVRAGASTEPAKHLRALQGA